MQELAYVNGVFGPIAEARVSIEDRAFQFGEGVYEVVVAYNGQPFLLEQHLRRLKQSLQAIELEFEVSALEPIVTEGLRRTGLLEAIVYIQLTRGTAPRNHAIPAGLSPTIVMTFKPLPAVSASLRQRGAHLMTTLDNRWDCCSVKAITLLPNTLAKNEALRQGYDDAIFVTESGEVRECTSANIFVVHGDRIMIPPRTTSILHGVTQGFVMECAAKMGRNVEESVFDVEALYAADEVLMSSSNLEVLGVTQIDGRNIGDGCVGPVTQSLYAEFRKRARGEVQGVACATTTN